MLIGKDGIAREEAGDFAGVRDAAGAFPFIDREAERVVGAFAIFEFDLAGEFVIGLCGKKLAGEEGLIPFGEIGGRHAEFSGSEVPASAFAADGARWAEGIAGISRGVLRARIGETVVRGGHLERMEEMLAQERDEFLAGDFFEDRSGDDVIGVAVLPFGAGLEIEGLFGPGVEDGLGRGGLGPASDEVVLRGVVFVAGGVGEQFADGDFVRSGEAGNVFGDFIVEGEFAGFLFEEEGGGGELLTDGADGVAGFGGGGLLFGEIAVPEGFGVGEAAVLDDSDGDARDGESLAHGRDGAVELGVERRGGLGKAGEGGGEEEDS